jgi:hypothetical protein
MSIKASQLKSSESQRRAVNKEVSSILAHIDEKFKSADIEGVHNVTVSVPIIFSIPNMSNADAQRNIYYKILTSLIDREFEVVIELTDDKSKFHITWLSDEEMKEIELQNALIAKHSRRRVQKD